MDMGKNKNSNNFLEMKRLKLKSLQRLKFSSRTGAVILMGGSACAVLTSMAAEYLWDLQPCRLCISQRLFYLALFSTSTATAISSLKLFKIACCTLLAALIFTASYHGMMQFGVINERCSTTLPFHDPLSFKASLERAPLPCSGVKNTLLGVPLSVWSGIFSAGLLGAAIHSGFLVRKKHSDITF